MPKIADHDRPAAQGADGRQQCAEEPLVHAGRLGTGRARDIAWQRALRRGRGRIPPDASRTQGRRLQCGRVERAVRQHRGRMAEGAELLADFDQGATANFPVEGYVVTKQWAQKYPRTLAAFYKALEEGQQIADTNRGAVEAAFERLCPARSASPRTPRRSCPSRTIRLSSGPGRQRGHGSAEARGGHHAVSSSGSARRSPSI